MNISNLWQLSATETVEAIRERKVRCVDVVEASLRRMAEVNGTLNAVVIATVDQALRQAKEADAAVSKGATLGPLHGVPITIKNNTDVAGYPTTNGLPAFRGTYANCDAPVVKNLKDAGAIVIGLTNTSEFSFRAFTDNPLFGRTHNPWHSEVTCGGSSGGAAAAVAMGIGAIAHGNDRGGSLRWPAHCCGVATIKPTLGRIPASNQQSTDDGPLMGQLFSTHGPIGRKVADLKVACHAMYGTKSVDAWWMPAPVVFEKAGVRRAAIAILPDDMEVDDEIIEHFKRASKSLEQAGYITDEVRLPDLNEVWQLWCDLLMTEFVTMQQAAAVKHGSEDFLFAMAAFKAMSTPLDLRQYIEASARRSYYVRKWSHLLATYDVILTPTTPRATPAWNYDLSTTDALGAFLWNDQRFVCAINALGLPAAVVPVGIVNDLPVSVQLVSARFREDLCLDAAQAIEDVSPNVANLLWSRCGS